MCLFVCSSPSSGKEAAPSKMASYGSGAGNGGGHLGGARGEAVFFFEVGFIRDDEEL